MAALVQLTSLAKIATSISENAIQDAIIPRVMVQLQLTATLVSKTPIKHTKDGVNVFQSTKELTVVSITVLATQHAQTAMGQMQTNAILALRLLLSTQEYVRAPLIGLDHHVSTLLAVANRTLVVMQIVLLA